MLAYTMTRQFLRDKAIDVFESLIWTERYYGDGDIVIVCPATRDNVNLLKPGTFVGISNSAEIMILETHEIKEGTLTVTGISLLKWLNNRFVRRSADHADRYWNIGSWTAGTTPWAILYFSCIADGPLGLAIPQARYIITGLEAGTIENTGPVINLAIPYGPLYDAMRGVAETYEVGMNIKLVSGGSSYILQFNSYRGADRTSGQSTNPVVRFSPDLESLANVQELQSLLNHSNDIHVFATQLAPGTAVTPGYVTSDAGASNFDLRAAMVFEDGMTIALAGSGPNLTTLLTQRGAKELIDRGFVVIVDGEVVPTPQFAYGNHYNLGDIVELTGYSGTPQPARVTEYIRVQDSQGERAYPTVAIIV